MKLSEEAINNFIPKKAQWISDKQMQVIEYGARQTLFALGDGVNILLQRKSYVVMRKNTPEVTIEGNSIIIPQEMTLDTFTIWMKEQAENSFVEK